MNSKLEGNLKIDLGFEVKAEKEVNDILKELLKNYGTNDVKELETLIKLEIQKLLSEIKFGIEEDGDAVGGFELDVELDLYLTELY